MRLKLDEHWVCSQEKHTRVPQRGLLVPNPEGFRLYLPDYNFSAKMPLVAPHCLWNTVITSGIKASRLLTSWTQIKIPHYLRQSWTPYPCPSGMGAACHCWAHHVLSCQCACAHMVPSAENALLYPSPGRNLLLLPQGIQFKYFHTHLYPMQPLCPAVHIDSDSTMFSPML